MSHVVYKATIGKERRSDIEIGMRYNRQGEAEDATRRERELNKIRARIKAYMEKRRETC